MMSPGYPARQQCRPPPRLLQLLPLLLLLLLSSRSSPPSPAHAQQLTALSHQAYCVDYGPRNMQCWGALDGDTTSTSSLKITHDAHTFRQLSGGTHFVCGIIAETGAVVCLDMPNVSPTGMDVAAADATTTAVAADTAFVAVSAGDVAACVVARNGTSIVCFGDDTHTQVSTAPPALDDGDDHPYSSVACADAVCCATRTHATGATVTSTAPAIVCWPPTHAVAAALSLAVATIQPQPITHLDCAAAHCCFVTAVTYQLVCFGDDADPGIDIGDGAATALHAVVDGNDGTHDVMVSASSLDTSRARYVHAATGSRASCGITVDGAVRCWALSPLRPTVTTTSGLFIVNGAPSLDSPERFSQLTCSSSSCCGVARDSLQPRCFGRNSRFLVSDVADDTVFASVGCGSFHTCGITTAGFVSCWGASSNGQVSGAPRGVRTRLLAVSAYHSCIVRTIDDALVCWGDGGYGQLLPMTTSTEEDGSASMTTAVGGGLRVHSVSVGRYHTCVLTQMTATHNATVLCTGGIGPSANILADASRHFVEVSGGRWHHCGRLSDDTVTCWGDADNGNSDGQLDVPVDTKFRALAHTLSSEASCGIKLDRYVVCWGNPRGSIMQNVITTRKAKAVSCGNWACCLLSYPSGFLYCWGQDTYNIVSDRPRSLTWSSVSVGWQHACGVQKETQELTCWGVDSVEGRMTAHTAVSATIDAAPQHMYRPAGGVDVACPQGTFSASGGSVTPLCSGPCARGFYGSNATMTTTTSECTSICPTGSYCPLGSTAPTLCPAGVFGGQRGLLTAACSGSCGGPSLYCPVGSTQALDVPAGHYSTPTTASRDQRTGHLPCPAGHYCSNGERHACPPGSFRNVTGAFTCVAAPPGTFTVANASLLPTPCPVGRFQSTEGQSFCFTCASGRYVSADVVAAAAANSSSVVRTGASLCVDCDVGRYQNDTGAVSCRACPHGRAQQQRGSVLCDVCTRGRFSVAMRGAVAAAADEDFSHADVVGAVQCQACARHTFQAQTAASTCLRCSDGLQQPATGAVSCVSCEPGQYLNHTSSSSSSSSSTLPWSTLDLQYRRCLDCPVGRFRNNVDSLSSRVNCSLCPPGTHQPLPRQTGCVPCPAGRVQPRAGAGACVPCAEDTFQSLDGDVRCRTCAVGRVAARGATTCRACDVGSVVSETVNGTCVPCPAGSAPSTAVQVDDSDANDGGSEAGNDKPVAAAQCVLCEVGKYAEAAGSARCLACASESFSLAVGAVQCQPCADLAGSVCVGGSLRNSNGVWMGTRSATPATSSVPSAATTLAMTSSASMSSFATQQALVPPSSAGAVASHLQRLFKVQFIAPPSPSPSSSSSSPHFTVQSTTPSVTSVTSSNDAPDSSSSSLPTNNGIVFSVPCTQNFCFSDFRCRPNAAPWWDNPLCAACAPGYIDIGGKCTVCDSVNVGLLVLVVATVVIFVLLNLFLAQYVGGHSTVFFYFVQIALFQVGAVDELLAWMGLFELDPDRIGGGVCIVPLDAYDYQTVKLLFPLFYIVVQLCVTGIHFVIAKCRSGGSGCGGADAVDTGDVNVGEDANTSPSPCVRLWRWLDRVTRNFSATPHVRGLLALSLLCYTPMTTTAVAYLRCVDITDDAGSRSVVFSSPQIDCDSSRYQRYLPVAVLVLVCLSALFPIVVGLALRRNRDLFLHEDENVSTTSTVATTAPTASSLSTDALKSTEVEAALAAAAATPPRATTSTTTTTAAVVAQRAVFRQRCGPLFEKFRSRHYYYQCWILCRRALFVALNALLLLETRSRYLSFLYLNVISLGVHLLVRPFVRADVNAMETGSLFMLSLLSGLLLTFDAPRASGVEIVISMHVLLPAALMLMLMFYQKVCLRVWNQLVVRQHEGLISASSSSNLSSAIGSGRGAAATTLVTKTDDDVDVVPAASSLAEGMQWAVRPDDGLVLGGVGGDDDGDHGDGDNGNDVADAASALHQPVPVVEATPLLQVPRPGTQVTLPALISVDDSDDDW